MEVTLRLQLAFHVNAHKILLGTIARLLCWEMEFVFGINSLPVKI